MGVIIVKSKYTSFQKSKTESENWYFCLNLSIHFIENPYLILSLITKNEKNKVNILTNN